jgi:putative ABC transport system permease protein
VKASPKKYHWKLGDKIPLQATIYPQKVGGNAWTFDLVGIYRAADPKRKSQENALFFNWDYFDEARAFGNGNVGWYVLKVSDRELAQQVAQAVDALSTNSDHETKTQTEQAFNAAFVSQFGDIGLIVGAIMGAVFFTLILLTGNTMAQAVRERIPGAGGAEDHRLLQSQRARTAAGRIGAADRARRRDRAAAGRSGRGRGARRGGRPAVPMTRVGGAIWLRGLGLMVLIGLIVGALPARRGMRLRIVDALAGR